MSVSPIAWRAPVATYIIELESVLPTGVLVHLSVSPDGAAPSISTFLGAPICQQSATIGSGGLEGNCWAGSNHYAQKARGDLAAALV